MSAIYIVSVGELACGIDIGGSGIKGAVVNLDTGKLVADRSKVPTPRPATPKKMAKAVAEVIRQTGWTGPVGVAFPAVIADGVALSAANIDRSWIGTNVEERFSEAIGVPVKALNDADAAGVTEARFGVARGVSGLVVMTTLGTGIGTALLYNGTLIPNSELGHMEIDGGDAEKAASAAAKDRENLDWKAWAERLQRYYSALEAYLTPDLFVVGGGVSRRAEKFLPLLELRAPIVAATFENEAGIVGAALRLAESGMTEGAA